MRDFLDTLIIEFDKGLKSSFINKNVSNRVYPANDLKENKLSELERNHSSSLMRVNHAGEVCAQALYLGQSLTAKDISIKAQMLKAADEEEDHLAWCSKRLEELEDNQSVFNPVWYTLSFSIGMLTGLAGDKWSLGFVEETEKQVVSHLDSHLHKISKKDLKSKAIIEQMKQDESGHANQAKESGSMELPEELKLGMSQVAKFMTSTSYYF